MWIISFIVVSMVTFGASITKPVYKISLTQKGYAQFLQYDVETPPLREFTFCAWVQFFELDNDQSIFTYVANGNNRVVRLWLDTGGHYMKIAIDERVLSTVPVDIGRDVWRHICLSYQSDHGAWALYIDARLVSCEAAQSLYSRVLPGGGSIIIGYGIANNGIPNGLEGEIFGVSMILSSTIERNYTFKSYPQFRQKTFHKNKVIGDNDLRYIVLGDMKTDKVQKRAKPNDLPAGRSSNASRNYIKLQTPYSFIEHEVGSALSTLKAKPTGISDEKEVLEISSVETKHTNENEKINFWDIINEAGNIGKFKSNINHEISSSGTQSHPKISEYETPPPPGLVHEYIDKPIFSKNPVSFHDLRSNNIPDVNKKANNVLKISDVETPPPPDMNTKVYGQWTSSKFASSVLNYLKSTNFNTRDQKKVPPTIPLLPISDSLPYASDIKVSKVRPSYKFQRRNFMIKHRINKRDVNSPQINVQIIEDNLRDQIIEAHAQTRPQNVEVMSRGHSNKHKEHRFYRNVQSEQSDEVSSNIEIQRPRPFSLDPDFKLKKYSKPYKQNNLATKLPFLKTMEYYVDNLQTNKKEITSNTNDMYSKSLSNGNKWHNVKSYSNDYTPRQINMNSPAQDDIKEKINEVNKKLPSIRLKYKPDSHKVETVEDVRIVHGRNLASEISNLSNHNMDSVSLLKYNHGFLHDHDIKNKVSDKEDHIILKGNKNMNMKNNNPKNNFDKQVKLGNALSERNVIGHNKEQNKQSFEGGDETVPDINRYRSDLDRESGSVPSSLGPRICKNVELYDRLFYVQADGSIDVTHILSPVREKNIGIEFIMENYRKCSIENTALEKSSLLFIDWNKTPVRLFGGAYPKKTTDLCGFF